MTHYPDPESLSIEALLGETRWMRVLAQSLVRDEHAAEDVVQDIWVAALERPPAPRWNVRRWARGVARNLARQHVRREERRARRERSAARGETLPSTEEMVERAVVQRAVVDAVLGLAEPYRSAILLRYFEEIPPRKIAGQQGVPVETVRTRLKRALELLRTRLDAEFGEDRRAWCLPLLLSPAATGSSAAGGAASLLGGGLGSLAAKIVGLAAVVLGVTTVGAFLLRPASEDPPPPHPEPARAVEAARPAGEPAPESARPRPARPGDSEPGAPRVEGETPRVLAERWSVSGSVEDAFGNALSGARVSAFETLEAYGASQATAAPLEALATTRTDEAGEFRIGPVHGWVMIEAACPGHARARLLTRDGSRLTIRLDRPGSLRGRVFAEGDPGPGVRATVVLFGKGSTLNFFSFGENGKAHVDSMVTAHASTETDEDGGYAFHDLAPGRYRVSVLPVNRPAVRFGSRGVRVRAGRDTLCDVVLPRPTRTRVVGRMVDGASGRPVAGARLRVQENPRQTAVSDRNGAFAFRGLRAAPRQVHVSLEGYADVIVRVFPAIEAERVVRIVLDRLARVQGRVVDAAGRGVSGAVVSRFARGADAPLRRGPATRTRADGSFTLGRVRPGPSRRLFAVAEGHAGGASSPIALSPGEARDGLVIRLTPGGAIDGRVQLPVPAGIPISLQTVSSPEQAAPDFWPSDLVSPVRADRSGRFRFNHVPPGRYRFTTWIGSQFHTFRRTVRVESGTKVCVDLDLELGPPLEGRVLDARGGPVPWATVRVLSPEPGRPADFAVSDTGGAFRFIGIGPGPHTLGIDSQGRFFAREVREVAAGREPVEIRLVRKPPFAGRVTRSSAGAPVRSFWVRVHPHARHASTVSAKRYFHDPEGRFELTVPQTVLGPPAVPGGDYDLEAGTDAGEISPLLRDLSLDRRESDRVFALCLEPGGFIRGAIRSPGGEPVPGARVAVTRVGAPATAWRVTVTSDARGRFAVGPIQARSFRLRVFHPAWSPSERVARVIHGGTTGVEVTLQPGGAIRVTARNGSGHPVRAASLTLQANEPRMVLPERGPHAETDASGRFTFRGLGRGSYTITGALQGRTGAACTTAYVRPGATTDVALEFREPDRSAPDRR